MRKELAFILILFLLNAHGTQAQYLVGNVVDADNHRLRGATVELLSARDSSVMESTVVDKSPYVEGAGWPDFKFSVQADSSYIVRFSMLGYKTEYRNVKIGQVAFERISVVMKEDAQALQEIIVKATRVKMVMRGDTIVYDATAFDLSEGSMLDALIRQLPGARLSKGVITINGRRVSSLLVDGRDFFNGDATMALKNLPAYTVDKVKVYDHSGEASRLMGRDMGDKELTVDVNLKKEYKLGFMANTDVGTGTEKRYNGQLFSMLYGKKDNFNVAASVNNLGNLQRSSGEISLADLPSSSTGLMSVKMLNMNYQHNGKSYDDNISTRHNLTWIDDDKQTRTNAQTFLSGGDYYDITKEGSRRKSREYDGMFSWGWHPKKQIIKAYVTVSHAYMRGLSESLSGQLTDNPVWAEGLIDSLFSTNPSQRLMDMAVNRVKYRSKSKGNGTQIKLTASDRIAIGKGSGNYGNMVNLNATFSYDKGKDRMFAHNMIDYLSDNPTTDYRSQYTEQPSHKYKYDIRATYGRRMSRKDDEKNLLFLNFEYGFSHDYVSAENGLYRLDQLADYAWSDYPLGMLPSSRDALLEVLDASNSYKSRSHIIDNGGTVSADYVMKNKERGTRLTAKLRLPIELRYERLNYFKEKSYERDRHIMVFNPNLDLNWEKSNLKGIYNSSLNYRRMQDIPALLSLLGLRNDANPLLVTQGNDKLKTSYQHVLSLKFGHMAMGTYHPNWNVSADFSATQNAIANSVTFDKSTGITTRQPVNVNGNWGAGGGITYSRGLDKQQKTELMLTFSGQYRNSVDLNSVVGTSSQRSHVRNLGFTGAATLSLFLSKNLQIISWGTIMNQRTSSDRPDFTRVNVWNYTAQLDLKYKLPWDLELTSNLLDYKMSGYNDDAINSNHLVWNARLLKKLMHGKLTVAVDAYDILKDNSPTTVTIDSQGRLETWTNSIPRYVMLHVGYKFMVGRQSRRF